MRKLLVLLAPTLLSVASFAQTPFSVDITVSETGRGLFTNSTGFSQALTGTLAPDPGPGGLASVLTYNLLNPPGLVAGDVLLREETGSLLDGTILDVVRFNATNGTLVFYSDNTDGFDSLADTFGPPGSLYPNNITINEIGTEANNGAVYRPTAGQPGFVAGAGGPVTYHLISDGTGSPVPEPSTFILLGTGLIGTAGAVRRRLRI